MKKRRVTGSRVKNRDLRGFMNLFEARLIEPIEAAQISKAFSKKLQHAIDGKWLLSGSVCSKVFSAIKAKELSDCDISIDVLSMPSGASYGVVRCDFENCQHLFVLPLYIESVREFFVAATTGPSHFQFINEITNESLILDCTTLPREFVTVLGLTKVNDYGFASDLLIELKNLVSNLSEITVFSPSEKWRCIQTVDVSILIPYEYLEALSETGSGVAT